MSSPTTSTYQEVVDLKGRVYRIGETDRELLGRSRAWMVWLPWVAMLSISVFEYGFGAATKTIMSAHHWHLAGTFWFAAIWAVFQAGVAFPAGRLREKHNIPARWTMLVGAVLCCIGYMSLAHGTSITMVLIGYSVIGGTGSGLVYATCINIVGKWYPEKRGGKTGFVNGGFAYGSVPFIYIFSYLFTVHNYRFVLDAVGLIMLVACTVCGWLMKDPPKNWWPAAVDPLRWQQDAAKSNVTLAKNPPAARQYTPMEAIRTGMLPLMWLSFAIIGGVSLFGINFQVPFAKESGFGPFVAASSAGLLAVVNGVGRGVVGWVSDRLGRKQTLVLVLVIAGLTQFGVLWSGKAHILPLFIVFAFLAGFGSGAFYPLYASLVPDYFGENNNAQNYGLVYTAKLVGSVAGVGLAAQLVEMPGFGYTGVYILSGGIAFVSAGLILLLRQPGVDRPSRRRRASAGFRAPASGVALAGE